MNNPNLDTALADLSEAIRAICLGSIEDAVIDAAGRALIVNWNDSNPDDAINEVDELAQWSVYVRS